VTDALLLNTLLLFASAEMMYDTEGASKLKAFSIVATRLAMVIPIFTPLPPLVPVALQLTVVPDDQAVVAQISAS
jgi:hypothetical protein